MPHTTYLQSLLVLERLGLNVHQLGHVILHPARLLTPAHHLRARVAMHFLEACQQLPEVFLGTFAAAAVLGLHNPAYVGQKSHS